ncbi:DUF1648 domain-containing protein [Leucobacter soli]|uniref:DUF1648 domain-containing protein n=1 Tax=Leucobacter soli TaxID=2812850 RepID=A0A916JUH6_9MICO|nr:DUF1648 domain-containing protein [Leucobacter soli]CAG7604744.1 hypothetical protein LEUCIP111803_00759 [Leucobacter soli]
MNDATPQLLSEEQRRDLHRARRAARWVGVYVPVAVVLIGLAVVIVWIPRLPDPAATHWGFSGGPDGFGSRWTSVWLLGGLGLGFILMMRLMVVFGGRGGAMPLWSRFQRFMTAFTVGFAAFIVTVTLTTAGVQLDLDDAADAPGVGGFMALSFGIWIVAGLVGWFAQPSVEIRQPVADPSRPLALAGTERAVWIGAVKPSRVFLWVIGAALGVLGVSTVVVFLAPVETAVRWIMFGVFLLVLALSVTTLWFGVRIDARGLEARSFLGWPAFRLPATEVESVVAERIVPFAEFGGWGLRWTPGRFGIVMRTGDGVVATREDGRIFAVTVDDAETAAALLAAVAEQARTSGVAGE